jgi:hypothetical protein
MEEGGREMLYGGGGYGDWGENSRVK